MITAKKLINFLTTLVLSIHFFHSADAKKCSPSACGAIRNISYPFRLKGDHSHCGDSKYELTCKNNVTIVYLNAYKYYVKAIDCQNSTIRLVDASINKDDICSFPIRSSYGYNFTTHSFYSVYPYFFDPMRQLLVNLISCPNPIHNSSLFTDITQDCASNLSHHRFSYVHVGSIMASEIPHMCILDLIIATSTWPGFMDPQNVSLSKIHQFLLYGAVLDIYNSEPSTIWGKKAETLYILFKGCDQLLTFLSCNSAGSTT
ncbi:uncharacterized protein LOC125210209 [Salvia hispanica]|uniref:uncharacterized protein LOC125210209 n=1 Tax=Salvia hispanica TaxID=49212 RepID=UPI002009CC01|nr:uncharacterized protein LOC125210209 [Salvia hispanica]